MGEGGGRKRESDRERERLIYFKELAHTILEPYSSQNLQYASRRAYGVVLM